MKKRLTLVLLTAGIMALVCTGCGKKDKSTKSTTKATESSIVQGEVDEDKDMKEDETDETSKENDNENSTWGEYGIADVNYKLPYSHCYNYTRSAINDTDETFIAMSWCIDDKYSLDEIIEKNREDLINDITYLQKGTYSIEKQEKYTTKNGIEGIKYEGTLSQEYSDTLWFYCFCFNGSKESYQFIGFSSKQITRADSGTYDLEATKAKIKDMMDKSIDTITIE